MTQKQQTMTQKQQIMDQEQQTMTQKLKIPQTSVRVIFAENRIENY